MPPPGLVPCRKPMAGARKQALRTSLARSPIPCDDGGKRRPVAFLGRLGGPTDMDEAGDALANRQTQGLKHVAVVGVPLGYPTCGIAHGVGGQDQAHGRGAGRHLLLPFRDLPVRGGATDHRDHQRRAGEALAFELDLLGRGVGPVGAKRLRDDLAGGEIIAQAFRANRADATPEQIEFEGKRFARAPLVIAVVSSAAPHGKIPEWEQQMSAGASAMSLVLAAHAMGYAASWITEWYAYDRNVLEALGLAVGERIAGFVHIGRPAKPPEERDRPALSAIVTRYTGPSK